MNKKGQGIMVSIVAGIFIFMVGALFINFIAPTVEGDLVRNETAHGLPALNCGNTTAITNISDGARATCLIAEATTPYFILSILSVAGAFLVGRFLTGK